MFSNSFQSGPHVDVFDSKVNRDKNEFYTALVKYLNPNGIKKDFDKEIKSYLIDIDGLSRLVMPKDDTKQLCLVQRYLVLQVFLPQGTPWAIELGITDTTKTKRRVMLTSAISKTQSKFFHVRCPIDQVKRGIWLNLAIDVYSYMNAFKGQTFRSLDQITVGAHCKLRRIFTIRECLLEFNNEDDQMMMGESGSRVFVPKQFQLNPDVIQSTQVIAFESDKPKDQTQPFVPKKSFHETNGQKIPKKTADTGKPSMFRKEETPKELEINNMKTLPLQKPTTTVSSKGIKSKIDTGLSTTTTTNANSSTASHKVSSIQRPVIKSKKQHTIIPERDQEQGEEEFSERARNLKKELEKYEDEEFSPITKHKKSPIFPPSNDNKFATQTNYSRQPISDQPPSPSLVKEVREENDYQDYAMKYEEFEEEYDYGEFDDSVDPHSSEYLDSMDSIPKTPDNAFPTSVLTKKNKQVVVVQSKPDQVDLIYDPMLECYYNPQTNMYYELK